MTRPRPKLCLATLYDEGFARVGDFCRSSLVRYGRRHGYDVAYSPGADCNRPHSWHKLLLISDLFDAGYESVLWVDADAMVVDFAADPADLIQPEKHLYMVRHEVDGRLIPNAGVFMLRNCPWSRRLIDRMWSLTQYVEHPWWENAALLHLLYRDAFEYRGVVNRDGLLLGENAIAWLPERWNHLWRHTQDGPPVIRHFASSTTRKRVSRMMRTTNPLRYWQTKSLKGFAPMGAASMPIHLLKNSAATAATETTPARAA